MARLGRRRAAAIDQNLSQYPAWPRPRLFRRRARRRGRRVLYVHKDEGKTTPRESASLRGASLLAIQTLRWQLQFPNAAEAREQPQDGVVDIDLPPPQPVPRRVGIVVMVVVPSVS